MIYGQHSVAARVFCDLVNDLLKNICNRLCERTKEMNEKIKKYTSKYQKSVETLNKKMLGKVQTLFTTERKRSMDILNFAKTLCRDLENEDYHRSQECWSAMHTCQPICHVVNKCVMQMHRIVLDVRQKLQSAIECIQTYYTNGLVLPKSNEIMHSAFKLGFDYHKEVQRLFDKQAYTHIKYDLELSNGFINIAKMWMVFAVEKCEQGRGCRPQWAAQGLEFLVSACDPSITKHLDESKFQAIKYQMENCFRHVVGFPLTKSSNLNEIASARNYLSKSSSNAEKLFYPAHHDMICATGNSLSIPTYRKQLSCDSKIVSGSLKKVNTYYIQQLRQTKVRNAVHYLEGRLERKLRDENLIGHVKTLNNNNDCNIGSIKTINFEWHRGFKVR